MKIFLIGRLRQFEETKKRFQPWADDLRKFGHEVINPLEILTGDKNWFGLTRECIKLLMECNAIFLLDDWNTSSVGKLSFEIAMKLRYDIFMEHDINFLKQMGGFETVDQIDRECLDWHIEVRKDGIYLK